MLKKLTYYKLKWFVKSFFYPKVPISIIMPIYNCESFVEQAIKSALNQHYKNFELIIVDDGSIDNTLKIANKYAKHKIVKIYSLPQDLNKGWGRPFNFAIRKSSGKYIVQLDGDDILHTNALFYVAIYFNKYSDIDMFFSRNTVIDENGETLMKSYKFNEGHITKNILEGMYIGHVKAYRKKLFNIVGSLNEDLKSSVDFDFLLRIEEVAKIGHIPKMLYYYRKHGNSITDDKQNHIKNTKSVIYQAIKRRGLTIKLINDEPPFQFAELQPGDKNNQ